MQRVLAHVLNRGIQRKAMFFTKRTEIHARNRPWLGAAPAGRADRALPDGQLPVWDDTVRVDAHLHAKPGADRACAVGVIKREHARRQFLDGNAAVLAGIILRKCDRLAAHHVRDDQPARERRRGFDRVGQPTADIRADGNTVDHDLDVMLFSLGQLDLLGQVAHFAVHPHTDVTLPPRVLKHLYMLALFAADDRCEDLHARFFLQSHQPVDDLVDCLLVDFLAALRAVRRTDTRPQQTHVIVNLGDRADRRAWVLRGGFLVD